MKGGAKGKRRAGGVLLPRAQGILAKGKSAISSAVSYTTIPSDPENQEDWSQVVYFCFRSLPRTRLEAFLSKTRRVPAVCGSVRSSSVAACALSTTKNGSIL